MTTNPQAGDGAAPTGTLSVTPSQLPGPGQVTLKWTTTGATSQTISGIGVVKASGSQVVEVYTATTFVLTVFSASGQTVTQDRTVTVPDLCSLLPPSNVYAAADLAANDPAPPGWSKDPAINDFFVIGASSDRATKTSDTTPGTHSHSTDVTPVSGNSVGAGAHDHNFPTNWSLDTGIDSGDTTLIQNTSNPATKTSSTHQHPYSINLPAVSTSLASVAYPQYYALQWIVKS